jgi:ferredoxin
MAKKQIKGSSSCKTVQNWKVRVDRDLCIGAATCVAIADKTFALDSENKAIILDSADKESKEAILDAAKGCPTAAIIIEDEKGRRIYPKK